MGRQSQAGVSINATAYDLTVKDPLVHAAPMTGTSRPTNRPTSTWLGRVHRGTPWQTLYLKAPGTSLATWMQWTGNSQLVTNWNGGNGVT